MMWGSTDSHDSSARKTKSPRCRTYVIKDFGVDTWTAKELKTRLEKTKELTSNFTAKSVRHALVLLEKNGVDGKLFTKMSVESFQKQGITRKIASKAETKKSCWTEGRRHQWRRWFWTGISRRRRWWGLRARDRVWWWLFLKFWIIPCVLWCSNWRVFFQDYDSDARKILLM